MCDSARDQGCDHPVAVVLTLCAAAVLGGMRSVTAIAGWVADVPAEVLARLYARPARRSWRSCFAAMSRMAHRSPILPAG
ncbi:MAG: hypothetical protein ACRDRX_02945 [Pseudonocardiaceae bacterium]